jgi:hypothetical protein
MKCETFCHRHQHQMYARYQQFFSHTIFLSILSHHETRKGISFLAVVMDFMGIILLPKKIHNRLLRSFFLTLPTDNCYCIAGGAGLCSPVGPTCLETSAGFSPGVSSLPTLVLSGVSFFGILCKRPRAMSVSLLRAPVCLN